MRNLKVVILLLFCLTTISFSFSRKNLLTQEIIKATSDWVLGDSGTARENCEKKLESKGGNISNMSYPDLRTKRDELERTWYQVDCVCDKKE